MPAKRLRVANRWDVAHDRQGVVVLIVGDIALPLNPEDLAKLKEQLDDAQKKAAAANLLIQGNGH